MEQFFIDMGISALLRILQNKKDLTKWMAAVAKVFVKIEQTAELVPELKAAIERKRLS